MVMITTTRRLLEESIMTGYGVPLEDPVTTYEEPAVPAPDSYGVIIRIITTIIITVINIMAMISMVIIIMGIIIMVNIMSMIIVRYLRQTQCQHQLDMEFHRSIKIIDVAHQDEDFLSCCEIQRFTS